MLLATFAFVRYQVKIDPELVGKRFQCIVVADDRQDIGIEFVELVAHQEFSQTVLFLGDEQHNVFGAFGAQADVGIRRKYFL